MADKWLITLFSDAPVQVIDGDRGKHYPKLSEFHESEYCLFLNAGNVTADGFAFSKCAFISADKDTLLGKGKLNRYDIVLTTRGTVGNVAFYDSSVPYERVRINSGMVILRPDTHQIFPRFLYIYLRSPSFKSQVAAFFTGSAQPQLPIRDIMRLRLPIPPLPEQRAIAAILGALDDKIELNRQMNQTLEAMAQALFKSWFVDFEPFRDQGMEPSLLRPIPKGWRVGTIEDLAEVTSGKRPLDRQPHRTKDYPVALCGGAGPMAWVKEPLYSEPILITGRVGTLGIVNRTAKPCWPSDNTLVVLAKVSAAYPFLYYSMKHFDFDSLDRGSTQPLVTQTDLSNVELALPPMGVLESFSDIVHRMFQLQDANEEQTDNLAAIRDTLLPKLLSGEIRIKDAEKFVEKAI